MSIICSYQLYPAISVQLKTWLAFSPSSSATRLATVMAAMRRGWVTTMRAGRRRSEFRDFSCLASNWAFTAAFPKKTGKEQEIIQLMEYQKL